MSSATSSPIRRRPCHPLADRLALLGGLALLLGDFLYLRWRLERVFTIERVVALALVMAVALVIGPRAPAWLTVGAEGLVLTAMQALLGRQRRP